MNGFVGVDFDCELLGDLIMSFGLLSVNEVNIDEFLSISCAFRSTSFTSSSFAGFILLLSNFYLKLN